MYTHIIYITYIRYTYRCICIMLYISTHTCIYIFYILSVSYRSIQVGGFPYLKNFRKGLLFQLEKSQSQLAAATASEDAQGAQEARHRLAWIYEKYRRLDTMEHEMINDKPSWAFGRMVDYGSLDDDAIRLLTQEEIE